MSSNLKFVEERFSLAVRLAGIGFIVLSVMRLFEFVEMIEILGDCNEIMEDLGGGDCGGEFVVGMRLIEVLICGYVGLTLFGLVETQKVQTEKPHFVKTNDGKMIWTPGVDLNENEVKEKMEPVVGTDKTRCRHWGKDGRRCANYQIGSRYCDDHLPEVV